ncbi:MAG TPA: branched-chain amino acid aminotransferase [Gemmatimonadales bacterium]|jgi:branched-chain amino acid aminotransferase|nr:branched-chain amino acid aminotransferase [Gemmatimonadales bacterium]
MTLDIAIRKATTLKPKPTEDSLGFGRYFTDHVFVMDFEPERGWHDARIVPNEPLGLEPAAAVLHYAQAVFDGLKAFRGADGRIRTFRLDDHCHRLNRSAKRLCMPPIDPAWLHESIVELLRVEQDWVPRSAGTSLYIRPTMIASEAFLGVRPAERFTYFVLLSPVGEYYSSRKEPVKIWVEMRHVRAAPGGLGGVKAAANYAASLPGAEEARQRGFDQVLWLDALEHRWIEEVGTMNLFVRIGDEVLTPPLDDTFLAGITRNSVLTLLRDWGTKVAERRVSIDELRHAHAHGDLAEVFGTGTAAVISPVGLLGFPDGALTIGDGKIGPVARRLSEALTGIQYARAEDRHGWMMPIT